MKTNKPFYGGDNVMTLQEFKRAVPELKPGIGKCPPIIEVVVSKKDLYRMGSKYRGGGFEVKRYGKFKNLFYCRRKSDRVEITPVNRIRGQLEYICEDLSEYHVEGSAEYRNEHVWTIEKECE